MEEDTFLNASGTNKDGFAGDRQYFKELLAKMNLIFMYDPERFMIQLKYYILYLDFRLINELGCF